MPKTINKLLATVLPIEGFIRLPQVLKVFPVSRSSWLAGVKSGRYPQSVKLGPRTTAWNVADIRQLLETINTSGNGGDHA